jgi:hypothetical protein
MAIHTDLAIYKLAYDLLSLVSGITKDMPRDFKASLGRKIHDECIDMLVLIGRANAATDKAPHITELLEHQHVAELLLRVSHDKRYISHDAWAAAVELNGRIGKQAGGWLKYSRGAARAPRGTAASVA